MENSIKPSPSSLQDAEKKKGLAKKKMEIVKSPKKVTLPKNFVTRKSLAKKQADILKNSAASSKGIKTRAKSNCASLDSLMAGFKSKGQAKTALGMPLKELSESAVGLLISHYKVDNEKVLSTTALAM